MSNGPATPGAPVREGYLAVLRLPGAAGPFSAALLGRLSYAMVTLSLLLGVQAATGSFAVAGAATGTFGVLLVVASPLRARCVDRFGASPALFVMGLLFAAALGGAAAGCLVGAPAWLLVGLAGAAGLFAPPLGAAMRVVWSTIAPTPRMLTRAYSLDAVAEEILFTTGPLIVGVLVLVATPVVALFTTAGVALIGTTLFTLAPAVRSRARATSSPHAHERPLRQRGFPTVLVALAGVGIVLGTMETAVPAFATDRGSAALSGILLALLSAGSAVAGLVYGHRTWRSSLSARLVVLSVGLAAASGLAALAPNEVTIGVVLLGAGLFLAPSLVTGYLLADSLTTERVRNEASTWINTAVNSGAAAGAALAGVLVDRTSTSLAFAVGAAIAVVLTVGAALRMRATRTSTGLTPQHDDSPDDEDAPEHDDASGDDDAPGHEKALPEGRA
ncbi:MFS transporter [Leifsonia sp. NPDC058248]|uniref:MFS transporter n=1 Tax=Leifsonia sp. NPDC058248 TaxID=3346402 RepID=UPI0036DA8218